MHIVRNLAFALLCATTLHGQTQGAAAQSKPNVLIFLVDDMGWQDTSLPFQYRNDAPVKTELNKLYRTPNMETLASRGLLFTNACAHTVCSPSRVSLMTGMTAARHHVTNWTYPTFAKQTDHANAVLNPPSDWRIAGMDASDIAFPKLLQKGGYRTIMDGKAHFGPMFKADETTPNASGDPRSLGFDINIAGWGAGGPGSYHSEKAYGDTPLWHVPGLGAYYKPTQTHTFLTYALTLELNKAMEDSVKARMPFFAYMSHYAIHSPYEIDQRYAANYPGLTGPMLGHATLIEGMDKSLGAIIRKLEDLKIAENTLIIFLGDNGAESPDTKLLPAPSAPLRGRKGTPYEGGMRVPFIAAWAKSNPSNPFQARIPIPVGKHNDDIVTLDDIFPTMLDIAGLPIPTNVDGKTLVPYFKGESGHHRPQEFVTHYPHDHNDAFFSTLRQENWKVIHRYMKSSWELYDLSNDIGEKNNLASTPTPENAARLMRMARHLAARLKSDDAQFPTEKATGKTRGLIMPDLPIVDTDSDGKPDLQEDANRNGIVDPGESDPDKTDVR